MRDRERRGFKIMQQKGHDALLPGVSQRIGQAFAASFASFTPSSPCELTFPSLGALSSQREGTSSHTHTQTHLFSLWRNASFYLQKPNSRLHVSRSQVPILSSVCLLYSPLEVTAPTWKLRGTSITPSPKSNMAALCINKEKAVHHTVY